MGACFEGGFVSVIWWAIKNSEFEAHARGPQDI